MKRRIVVQVKPRSKIQKVEPAEDGKYVVYVISEPKKGKANKELIEILAEYFRIPKSKIKIVKGFTSRIKIIELED